MKNGKLITIAIALIALVGGGSFFAGVKYQQSKSPFRPAGQFQQRLSQGLRAVNGEILSADEKSITVKLQDGSSKIVLLTGTTAINKSSEGSREDLKAGEMVATFGTENSDGSVTAQNIQLNPTFRGMSGSESPRN